MRRVKNLILDNGDPANIGKAFGAMMEFISGRKVVRLEVVAESLAAPGKTDRLIVRLPKTKTPIAIPLIPRHDRRRGGRRR
jgi:hypothetical protein